MSEPRAGESGVTRRAALLREVVDLTRGRLDDSLTVEAEEWLSRSVSRLTLGGNHTVVALAGATGSGKSSTFNALTGMDLAAVGVRRPTTSWTMACVFGSEPAEDVMTWLDIPARHQMLRGSSLLDLEFDKELEGLVLLDLPDHDSTEVSHHVEMARLVAVSDVVIWVLDPQKYADAAIHDRFLRPLADHSSMMAVILNHIDEVPLERREGLMADLRHLLTEDGLGDVTVFATSATEGAGIDELRAYVAQKVGEKRAVTDKLNADLTTFGLRIQEQNGAALPGQVARAGQEELVEALVEAAGVPVLARALRTSRRHAIGRLTGWPFVSWMTRFVPDPNERAGLGTLAEPRPVPVERQRVDAAVRRTADQVGQRLPERWAGAVRRATEEILPRLGDELDASLAELDFEAAQVGSGWRAVRLLHLLFAVATVAGVSIWGASAAGWMPEQNYGDQSLGSLVTLAGAASGLLLALVMYLVGGLRANVFASSSRADLVAHVGEVTERLVITPMEAEVASYRRAREALIDLVG
jgi:GTPase Era involved in 16S rRNA processing